MLQGISEGMGCATMLLGARLVSCSAASGRAHHGRICLCSTSLSASIGSFDEGGARLLAAMHVNTRHNVSECRCHAALCEHEDNIAVLYLWAADMTCGCARELRHISTVQCFAAFPDRHVCLCSTAWRLVWSCIDKFYNSTRYTRH